MATLTSPTLQNLISNVRTLLSSRDPQNSFWTDQELTEYINEAVRIYFAECVIHNEGYFTASATMDITSGQETVPLPTDCFEIRAVYKTVTNGYIMLPYRNNLTEGYSTQGGSDGESYLPYYYFQGNNLILRPVPQFSQVAGLKIEYLQFPDQMIYGGDGLTNQVSPVFKQLIEMYAVYKAKLRESMVNGVEMHIIPQQNLDILYNQFKNVIERRSKNPTYVIPFNPEMENF